MTTREGEAAGRRVDAYLNTIERMEPDISMVDAGAGWASIAISLKRIADALDHQPQKIHDAIYNALMAAELHTRNR